MAIEQHPANSHLTPQLGSAWHRFADRGNSYLGERGLLGLQARFLRPLLDYFVDKTKILGHLRGEEHVALERVLDLLQGLARMANVDFVQPPLEVQDLLRVEHDVGGLALEPA